MGKQELRYAAKVSLDKPAAEQACLHVSLILSYWSVEVNANLAMIRIDGIQMVLIHMTNLLAIRLADKIAVPSCGTIKNNEVVKIECVDWTGGQIGNNDSADDVKNVDLTRVHYLTGPFEIETTEPGDVLLVEIQDVQPLQTQPWGFTGVFDRSNGGGFLDEIYPKA